MTKVRHPLFSEIVKDVQDAESWLRAGWVRVGEPGSDIVSIPEPNEDEGDES